MAVRAVDSGTTLEEEQMRYWALAGWLAITAGVTAATLKDHEWKATLNSEGGSAITGKAEFESEGTNASKAEVEIKGAAPGQSHPWHVHQGSCGNDKGIVGGAASYKPLTVKGDGSAKSEAKLALPTPTSGEYFVNVHKSADDLKTIVACGNLVLEDMPSEKEKSQAQKQPSSY